MAAEHTRLADAFEKQAVEVEKLYASVTMPTPSEVLDRLYSSLPAKRRGGKQPGAISAKWKAILVEMAEWQELISEFTKISDIVDLVAKNMGRTLRPAEIKRQFDPYVTAGYLSVSDEGYHVTKLGFEKIGFNGIGAPKGAPDAEGAATPSN